MAVTQGAMPRVTLRFTAGIPGATGETSAATIEARAFVAEKAIEVGQDAQQVAEDKAIVVPAAEQVAEDRIQTGLDRAATGADRTQTGLDRTAAQTAKTQAETARDAAQAGANVYADVATGLAATTNGQQFMVPVGDEIVRYRRDSASVATEVARYPSAEKVEPFKAITSPEYAVVINDPTGAIAVGVKKDGSVEIGRLNGETDVAGGLQGGAKIRPQSLLGYAWTILDGNGLAAAGVKNDGTFAAAAMEAQFLNGVSVAEIIAGGGASGAAIQARIWPAEYNMVLSYGQSLSVGADAVPPITATQRFDSVKFVGGVRSQDSGTPYTSLVPLTETQVSTLGETPIGGATDMIKERILAEDQLAYTDHSFQLIGCAPGAGGTAIAGLSIGTTPYNRFKADVQAGYTLAQAAGKSFSCNAFFWTQAESDYINNTSAATYKAAYIKLRDDLENDVQAITGRSDPLHCISYQVNAHATYGYANNPYLAVAQWEVARDNAGFHVACPLYWSPQTIHQTAQNSKILGAYYGLCYKRVIINGEDWRPLSPLAVSRQGNVILLELHVPVGKLAMDNVLIPLRTNYGFSVVDSVGAAVTISSVTITGPNTVKVVTAAPAAGGRLRYGFTNGGNLRDQQGDTIIFSGGGLNHPMHNWCVIFSESLN